MWENIEFLKYEVLGNELRCYLAALVWFVGGVVILKLLKSLIIRNLKTFIKKTKWKYDDFLLALFEKTVLPLLYLGSFYFAVNQLTLNPTVTKVIKAFSVIVLTIQAVRFILTVATLLLEESIFKKEADEAAARASKGIINIIKLVVWGIGVVFILDNLGFDVSAVVAGLGIGGIAVAFAARAILSDLFNYFVIFFDKPFEEGDFIVIDSYSGTIEHVGIKTTRLRSLPGEQIVIPNSDLTSSCIRNYKRMEQRRVVFSLAVEYETDRELLNDIPAVVEEAFKNMEDAEFNRAHLKTLGEFSLEYEIVYYVTHTDYTRFMDIQQEINLDIINSFREKNIRFAYPTQTVHTAGPAVPAVSE